MRRTEQVYRDTAPTGCKGSAQLRFFIVHVLSVCWAVSSCEPYAGGPPPHAEWEMTFHDEFDGAGVNWEVWASEAGPRGGDKPEGRWPENNVVKDGILYQVTKKEAPPRGGKEWSSAHIWTRTFCQKYGYFEARMRYGRYLNNAFWVFRPPGARFPDPPHFEIDINEGHTPRDVAMTLHFYVYPEGEKVGDMYSTGKVWKAPVDLDKDFHVYAVEWNEQEIIWRFDGAPVRRLKNPNGHAPADVRLSTVIMTRALEKDGVDINTMNGVSMAIDWVRVYQKKRDLCRPKLPELEVYKVPEIVKRDPQVAQAGRKTELFKEDFESAGAGSLPQGWEIGDGRPAVVADKPDGRKQPLAPNNKALRLAPGDYVFRMFDRPVTGRLEIELDGYTPWRKEGLLLVTLGDFRKDDPEPRKDSYYTGDIGPYIHWQGRFISYYTEQDKWTPFAPWARNCWGRFRFVLDVRKGVFDCYGGSEPMTFIGGGVFRHRQKAAKGIGLRHRGAAESVFVDNVVVRALEE